MDPFAASVNVLTVLDITCRSSFLLYRILRGIHDAQAELDRYCTVIENVGLALSALQTLHSEEDITAMFSANFKRQLEACLCDLQKAHLKLEKTSMLMHDTPFRKGWERVKWTLFSENWLEKFFARLQTYNIAFSMELACMHL